MNSPVLEKATRLRQVRNVFMLTLVLNLLVSVSELSWAYYTHTLSLMADGFHSLLDATSNVVGILGLYIAAKPPDPNHPYGHRKFEAMAAMMISFFIFLTFFEVVGLAVGRLTAQSAEMPLIGPGSYLVKLLGLGVNLFVVWYEGRKAREYRNALLLADTKHTMSDILVSSSVLVSMALVQFFGWVWIDVAMAGFISVIILKVGYDVIMSHLGSLVDEAVLDPAGVKSVVMAVPGVRGCHVIRSRGMHDNVFVDLHIQVAGDLTVKAAHQISYDVERALRTHYDGQLADVLVHVEEESHEVHPEAGPLL